MTKRVARMIYWEPQVAGLCGQHCINSLLQVKKCLSPFFLSHAPQSPVVTAGELAEIALRLDALEQVAMAEDGVESTAYLKYMAEDSGNVAGDGNFSVSVLSEALKVWNLEVVSINHPDERAKAAKADPLQENAFILNLGAHWFSVRKLGGVWWNLNSLNTNGPEEISDFYLSLLFDTLKSEGYEIFVIVGDLPEFGESMMGDSFSGGGGRWVPCYPKADRGREEQSGMGANDNGGGQGGENGGEDSLQAAIEASLRQEEEDAMNAAIAASMADSGTSGTANQDEGEDEAASLALSRLLSYPEPDAGVENSFTIQIRTGSGETLKRLWSPDAPVSALYDFVAVETGAHNWILKENGTQRAHPSSEKSIAEDFGTQSRRIMLLATKM